MVTASTVTKNSECVGDECALCRQPFAPGDDIIVCPIDSTHHHTHCWHGNGDRCAALGCAGQGEISTAPASLNGLDPAEETPQTIVIDVPPERERRPRRQRRTRPPTPARPPERQSARPQHAEPTSTSRPQPTPAPSETPALATAPFTMQLAQSCVVLAIAIAIVVMAFSCFGLWMLADYIALEVLEWNYRPNLIIPLP